MANNRQNTLNMRINKKIEQLRYKMRYRTNYIDVIQEKFDLKRQKELDKLKKEQQKQLYESELKTLTKEAYQELFEKPRLDQLDNKLMLKQKALLQSQNKKLKKKSVDEEALQATYNLKNEQIIQKINAKKELITKENPYPVKSKSQLKENIKVYDQTKLKFKEAYETKNLNLLANFDEIINKHKVKVEIENKKSKLKIDALLIKKKALDIVDEEFELKDDVILSIQGLTMKFGGLVAVDQLSFDVKTGEVFGLIGPNGAGKTTVFNCITQFYKASSGRVIYRNRSLDTVSLNTYKVHNVIKEGIVRTFQNVELIWELSILDNLLVGAHTLYHTHFFSHLVHSRRYKREEEIMRLRAIKILTDLDLIGYKDFYPLGLPYGILKQVELARTLMSHPRLIILDEPAAGLNDVETDKLIQTIRKIQKDYKCTIFLVEHDMGLVMEICDTICAISFGKKLAIGTPKEIQSNKLVQEAYLGGE